MMKEAFASFEAEIDKLIHFLDASAAEDSLIKYLYSSTDTKSFDSSLETLLKPIQSNSTTKRRQSYVSSIIVLYGALERYFEEAVEEFTGCLVDIYKDFRKLPDKLRDQHTRLTIDYLASVRDGKVRETEDIASIVSALSDCLRGHVPFRLNARAFSLRSSNMKLGRIKDTLKNLNINLCERTLLSTPKYSHYLYEKSGRAVDDMSDTEVKGLLEHIDELVSLRNDIAHGVVNIESIEGREIVLERCEKLRVFIDSINEILISELFQHRISLNYYVSLQGTIHVFGDRIIGFEWPSGRLSPGDVILMKPSRKNAIIRYGEIESIEVNRENQAEVYGSDGLMVTVRLPFKVKANGKYYLCHD